MSSKHIVQSVTHAAYVGNIIEENGFIIIENAKEILFYANCGLSRLAKEGSKCFGWGSVQLVDAAKSIKIPMHNVAQIVEVESDLCG